MGEQMSPATADSEARIGCRALRTTLAGYERGREEYLLLEPGGRATRLSEALARSGTLVLLRGSFDPLHNGHVALLQTSMRRHPDAWGAFALSAYTARRPLGRRELLRRARLILGAGHPVVLSRSGLFYEDVEWLRSRAPDLKVVLVAGVDTLSRVVECSSPKVFEERYSGVVLEYARREGFEDPFPALRSKSAYAGIRLLRLDRSVASLSSAAVRRAAAEGRTEDVLRWMPSGGAGIFLARRGHDRSG